MMNFSNARTTYNLYISKHRGQIQHIFYNLWLKSGADVLVKGPGGARGFFAGSLVKKRHWKTNSFLKIFFTGIPGPFIGSK